MKLTHITSPSDCVPLLTTYGKKHQEHFGIICIDNGLNVISKKVLFIGGSSKAFIDTKVILWETLKKKASAVIIFHNHTSNNSNPSAEDIDTTNKLKKAFEICGIQLLDHIIIARDTYFSFTDHNMIESEDNDQSAVAHR